MINYDESDNEPYQIVYGGLMYECSKFELKKIINEVEMLKEYAQFTLEEDKVIVSAYLDIVLYPSYSLSDGFIPFAALMQTTYKLENMEYSVTMFPAIKEYYIWECMVNRTFLLACRKSSFQEELTLENWRQHISFNEMMEAYRVSDLYIPTK